MGATGRLHRGATLTTSLSSLFYFFPFRLRRTCVLILSVSFLSCISVGQLHVIPHHTEYQGNWQSLFAFGISVETLSRLRAPVVFSSRCSIHGSRGYHDGKTGATPRMLTAPSDSAIVHPRAWAPVSRLETQRKAISTGGVERLASMSPSLPPYSSPVARHTSALRFQVALPPRSPLAVDRSRYLCCARSFSSVSLAHISSAWRPSRRRITPSLSVVRTLPVFPGSPGLRLFTLALARGRLAELPAAANSKGSSFLLLDSADTAESLRRCRYMDAVGMESGEGQREAPVPVRDPEQVPQTILRLLKTVPVYAVVAGDLRQVVPASFPSSVEDPRRDENLEISTQPTLDPAPFNTRKRLHSIMSSQLSTLQTLQNTHADDGDLGLFFVSPRDAEVYLNHVRSQVRSGGSRKREGDGARLSIATTSLANVYSLLVRPRPSGLPQRLRSTPFSMLKQFLRGGVHLSKQGLQAGWNFESGKNGATKKSGCSRYILVPDSSELDLFFTETGGERFRGTPLFFVSSQSTDQDMDLLSCFQAFTSESASHPVVPLYLSRADAEAALRHLVASRQHHQKSCWRWLFSDNRKPAAQFRVGVTSLESFLERSVSAFPFLPSGDKKNKSCSLILVPPRHSFEYCKQHVLQEDLGGPLHPFRKLFSHPTMRKLTWWRKRVIREIVKPVVSVFRGESRDEEPVGDLLPDGA
ncbi:hypothetical protein CSUI_004040 [Cystoisospora suis]|uniref:Uncharacterized protein n=1 Tax=Cystoisospora suis TaxID=483139 RepID=A0A2C6L202_9APIC|nr:hypothetical protein CSUI_004040 [Cystoisospora suis]